MIDISLSRATLLATLVLCRPVPAGDGIFVSSRIGFTQFSRDVVCSRGSPTVAIPFQIVHGVPVIKLSVNRAKDELFLVDSGNERTILNSDEAPRLKVNLTLRGDWNGFGTGDTNDVPVFSASSIRLHFHGAELAKGDILSLSLSSISSGMGIRLAGVLGYDVLSGHPTAIDYLHQELLIYEKNRFVAPPIGCGFELDTNDSLLPIVDLPVGVEGHDYGSARVLVDSGSDRGLLVFGRFASKHSFESPAGSDAGRIAGIGGESTVFSGLSGWVIVSGRQVPLHDVAVAQAERGVAAMDRFDAALGGPFLRSSAIVFDLAHSKIYFADHWETIAH